MNNWIVSSPGILGGKPCVRGTRLSVEFVLELLAGGATHEEIAKSYPQLPPEAIAAAVRYSLEVLRNETVWDVRFSA